MAGFINSLMQKGVRVLRLDRGNNYWCMGNYAAETGTFQMMTAAMQPAASGR